MVSNIILVDSSFTTFYRFFATLRWFSLAHMDTFKKYKDDPSYDWSMEPAFIDKYKKMYLESIKQLVKPAIFNNSKIIFCLDSPQETLWRKELYSCYKGNRTDLSEKTNFKPTFKLTYDELIPNLVKENKNISMIKEPNMEADDLIALAVKLIRYKKPNKSIYLISGDNDFLQLGFDKLYFGDYKKKDVFQLTKEEAKESLRQKIINGDCSDNIPSIFQNIKINNKTKKLLKENKDELKKYLKENPDVMIQYNNNKNLIDFKHIPEKFRKPVYRKLKLII